MKKSLPFKPRARLLLQLGDQLIRNESIALLELIKNSYDADATKVEVNMVKVDNCDEGVVIIKDNGTGMDIDILENIWMEPGSEHKERLYLERTFTPRYKRLPLGEKGIGRFGVHKLGLQIELISKMENRKEVYLKIEWNKFAEPRYLKDVPIDIFERVKPEVFTGEQTGTKIIIKKLRNPWSRGAIREIYRSINALCSPFDAPDSFSVDFDIDNKEWIKGLKRWEDFKEDKLFQVSCEIEGNQIKSFRYEFSPWPAMKKLQSRVITEKDFYVEKRKRMVKNRGKEEVDLSKFQIGTVKLEASIFDLGKKILDLGLQDRRGLQEYLVSNGGIRVYRDGIRVYDYGEPGNDWLELDARRVNLPSGRLSNNLVIGAVHLQRNNSSSLIEKTNREGFVENEAYQELRSSIHYVLFIFQSLRNADKEKIRTYYGPTRKSEPVTTSINELREALKKNIKDEKLRDEFDRCLTRIEDDYRNINETLLKSAGAGLSLSVAIHEIEKIAAELKKLIEKERTPERIRSLIKHLADIVENYGSLVRKSAVKTENVVKIIDQALFNIELRLEVHNVTVIRDYKNNNNEDQIKCKRNLMIGSIMNIIDNSIWWLEYSEIKEKKVFISISHEQTGNICILIADNGKGFALPTDEIVKPFVSGKPDGMGLGLHIVSEVMHMQGGKLIFPEKDDFGLPEEFRDGAIIALVFKKET